MVKIKVLCISKVAPPNSTSLKDVWHEPFGEELDFNFSQKTVTIEGKECKLISRNSGSAKGASINTGEHANVIAYDINPEPLGTGYARYKLYLDVPNLPKV